MLFNNRRPDSGQQYQTRWVWGVRQDAKRSAPKPFQEAIMKHNEHFMAWLNSLRNEALKPETTMSRTLEIFKTIGKYTAYQ